MGACNMFSTCSTELSWGLKPKVPRLRGHLRLLRLLWGSLLLVTEMRSEGGTTRWRRSCPHGARPRPSARQGPCRLWPSAFFGPNGYSACSTSLINWRASQPCSLRLNWASMGSKGFKLSRGLALKQGTTQARAQGSHRLIPTKH